ncbi:MAG: hypothetical protein J5907_00720 [Bacteroidales bacterium]|nr:hypothetical protein [Bacteroidales bacterium]
MPLPRNFLLAIPRLFFLAGTVWAPKLGKTVMRAKQISKRGGIVGVRLGEERVYITGQACLFMEGDIPFDL